MGFPFSFFNIKLNNIFLQMYVARHETDGKTSESFPVSKSRHINSIFTVNTPILYMKQISIYLYFHKANV